LFTKIICTFSKNVGVTPGTGTDPEPAPFFRENIDM
jgi:hypothetical protein